MDIPNVELMKQRLREARESYGLTQKELGELTGTSKAVIMALENITAMKAVQLDTMVVVADVLDISIDWLFGRTNEAGIREVSKIVEQPVVVKYFNGKWNREGEDALIRVDENETL